MSFTQQENFRSFIDSARYIAVIALGIFVVGNRFAHSLYSTQDFDITPPDVQIQPVGQLYPPNHSTEILSQDQNWTFKNIEEEKMCLAKNIYFEARGQIMQGQIAVALVTLNRVKSPKYPNSICEVVWQQNKSRKGKIVPQFSWTLDGKSDKPKRMSKSWRTSYALADAIIGSGSLYTMYDFTEGALFYHAVYVSPYWRHGLEEVATIGDHIFYREN